MSNHIYIALMLLTLCSIQCTTYRTFYKETTSITSDKPHKAQRLDLSTTSMSTIQERLSDFENLHMLDLTGNTKGNLAKIFEQVPYPEKLQVLILDSLELQILPENIMRFSQLRQLSLRGNPKLDLEQVFLQLAKLPVVFLNLQHNQLSSLPPTITKIQTLKDLNLSYNTVKDSTTYTHLSKLPNLKSLWLNHNQLVQIPNNLTQLNQLNNLYIEYNALTELPDTMIQMKKLHVIHAGHNNFEELPRQFAQMSGLLLLHINTCKINNIPNIFGTKTSNVLGLVLDQNPLSDTDKKIWKKKLRHCFLLTMEQ